MKLDAVPHAIHDVRGHESEYSVDRHGFAFHPHVAKEKTFDDDERIKTDHYAEVIDLLKDTYVKPSLLNITDRSGLVLRESSPFPISFVARLGRKQLRKRKDLLIVKAWVLSLPLATHTSINPTRALSRFSKLRCLMKRRR